MSLTLALIHIFETISIFVYAGFIIGSRNVL